VLDGDPDRRGNSKGGGGKGRPIVNRDSQQGEAPVRCGCRLGAGLLDGVHTGAT